MFFPLLSFLCIILFDFPHLLRRREQVPPKKCVFPPILKVRPPHLALTSKSSSSRKCERSVLSASVQCVSPVLRMVGLSPSASSVMSRRGVGLLNPPMCLAVSLFSLVPPTFRAMRSIVEMVCCRLSRCVRRSSIFSLLLLAILARVFSIFNGVWEPPKYSVQ